MGGLPQERVAEVVVSGASPDSRTQEPGACLARPSFAWARDRLAVLAKSQAGRQAAVEIHRQIPELRARGDQRDLFEETVASCTANVEEITRLLAGGVPARGLVVPDAAVAFARGLVRRQIPLTVLLRAYQLGHRFLWGVAATHLRDGVHDERDVLEALDAMSRFLFDYVDRVCEEIVAQYQVERDRWVRSSAAIRADIVREILAGEPVDERAASARLGYELGRFHTGLILAGDIAAGAGLESLERQAIAAAATLGCREPLMVPAGGATLWAWCGSYAEPNPGAVARLERFQPEFGVRIAIGRPGHRVGGFRTSHEEAGHASRFWSTKPGHTTGTVAYRDVELVSLLAADRERARRFVLAELGELAAATEPAAALRETLLVFLAYGGSFVGAAEALHVHKNTVYTRVRRAESLLAGNIAERRTQIQTALMLSQAAGEELLR
jgi:DNA-binding PucR family transcriptional regulator